MSKTFSQFVQESHIKSINEEELVQLINDLAEEHDLTEEETQEVLDELFGIGSTLKRIGSKMAHPFKLVHAGVSGAYAGAKKKASDIAGALKDKSASMDREAAKKLQLQKMKQGKQKSDVYKKASGGVNRPKPVKKMTDADKSRLSKKVVNAPKPVK